MNSEFVTTSSPRTLLSTDSKAVSDHGSRVSGRLDLGGLSASAPSDETLVVDDRSGLSPAQLVETKLTRRLKEATLPVSHLQMRGLLRKR